MSFKQEDIEKFECDWDMTKKYLEFMLSNKILSGKMYSDLKARVKSIESLVVDISDCARSDKD